MKWYFSFDSQLIYFFYIHLDRDLALLQSGGRPSPQRDVSTNIFGAFFDLNHDTELAATLKWLQEEKIGEKLGLDINDPKNAFGYIKLGEFQIPPEWANYTKSEIIKELSPYRKIVTFSFTVGMHT